MTRPAAEPCDDWWQSLPLRRREQLHRWFGNEGAAPPPPPEIPGQRAMFHPTDFKPKTRHR